MPIGKEFTQSTNQGNARGTLSDVTIVCKLLVEQSPNGSLLTSRMASTRGPTETPGLVHDRFDPIA